MFTYAGLIEKKLTIEERLEIHDKKEEAIRNKLKKHNKLELPEEEEEQETYTLDSLNPHYYCREPISYNEAQDKYGLVLCDVETVSNSFTSS